MNGSASTSGGSANSSTDNDSDDNKHVPFLVCGVDPGITQGALACVDLCTGRMVDATPYSLAELREVALREPDRQPALPSTNELAECIHRSVRHEHSAYYDGARHVFIEQQMKSMLHAAQVATEVLVLHKRSQSSMTALRAFHGTRVSESAIAGPKRNRRRAAYEMRKELSMNVAERDSVMPADARDMAWRIAIKYWSDRIERYQLTTTSQFNQKVHKAYSDIVEAYMHAAFPGNWRVFIDKIDPEIMKRQGRQGFRTVLRRLVPDQLQPTLKEAAQRHALPLNVLQGIHDYEQWMRQRRKRKPASALQEDEETLPSLKSSRKAPRRSSFRREAASSATSGSRKRQK